MAPVVGPRAERLVRSTGWGWVAAATALLLATVAMWSGIGGETTSVAIADLSAVIASLGGAVVLLRAARRDPDERRAWLLLSGAMALWGAGEVLWSWYEVVLRVDVPFPSVADIAYLSAVPVAVVGVLAFARTGGRFQVRTVLDGCLVASAMLFVAWALVLGPAWQADGIGLLEHVISVSYPATDLVLTVLALVVLLSGNATRRSSLWVIAAGLLVMAGADTAFSWLSTNGTFASNNPISMLWPLSYLMLALAPTLRASDAARPAAATETTAATVVPYLPLVGVLAVSAPRLLDGRPFGSVLAIDAAVLVGLLLVRQAVTAWDLRHTVRSLAVREEQLARLALEDPLTGLANRARFAARLEASLARPTAEPAVVYIDLDGFKQINDRFGHATGDELLIEVALRLRACMTPSMLLARLGGDEFVVLVEDGHAIAVEVARDILDAFSLPFAASGELIPFQASLGIAAAPAGGSPDEAVRRADAAMYVAKASGKGRAVDYPDEDLLTGPVRG